MLNLCPEDDAADARERYLARHENSRYWVEFSDFGFFRLQPIDIYYVGGFGVMGWVEVGEYEQAAPDPLVEASSGILAHMNADHVDAMILLARSHAQLEATEATMTSVDRLGFSLRLKTKDGVKGVRINFLHEVANPAGDTASARRNGAAGSAIEYRLTQSVQLSGGRQSFHNLGLRVVCERSRKARVTDYRCRSFRIYRLNGVRKNASAV